MKRDLGTLSVVKICEKTEYDFHLHTQKVKTLKILHDTLYMYTLIQFNGKNVYKIL